MISRRPDRCGAHPAWERCRGRPGRWPFRLPRGWNTVSISAPNKRAEASDARSPRRPSMGHKRQQTPAYRAPSALEPSEHGHVLRVRTACQNTFSTSARTTRPIRIERALTFPTSMPRKQRLRRWRANSVGTICSTAGRAGSSSRFATSTGIMSLRQRYALRSNAPARNRCRYPKQRRSRSLRSAGRGTDVPRSA
jgi:hypothetical protein